MNWTVREQDGCVTFSVTRSNDQKGLYKAYAVGPSGRCLLGTLTPDGPRLFLRRSLRRAVLEDAGAWPVRQVDCVLAFPFAAEETGLDRLFPHDAVLRRALRASGSVRFAQTPSGFTLTYPFRRGPFPMLPVFCFACVTPSAPCPTLTFSFSPDGVPQMPEAK